MQNKEEVCLRMQWAVDPKAVDPKKDKEKVCRRAKRDVDPRATTQAFMKNAVVLNEVKLAFVRSAATLYHFHSVLFWFCGFCSAFVRSAATLLSFSLGFVASKARLFLFCLCGAKRPKNHYPSVLWSEATCCFCAPDDDERRRRGCSLLTFIITSWWTQFGSDTIFNFQCNLTEGGVLFFTFLYEN